MKHNQKLSKIGGGGINPLGFKAKVKYSGKLYCSFCGTVQEVTIRKSNSGGKNKVSDNIVCIKCTNFIPHKNKLT